MKQQFNSSHVPNRSQRKSSDPASVAIKIRSVLLVALMLFAAFPAVAFTLDDFNGGSLSGWASTLNGGSVVQSGGQLAITPAAAANFYSYTKKTDRTFTNLATHTLEFKVLVNSILTNGVSTNGLALLGWVPTGGVPGANGYFMGVGAQGVVVYANASPIYLTNLTASLQSSNMYLALRLTPDGANMIIKSTVYNKTDGRYNVLFEHTSTNTTSTLIGVGGNAIVGAWNDASGAATSVSFDDLQYFDTVRSVLDDFSGPYPGASWTDYTPGTATNYNDGAGHLVTVDQSAGPTSGTFKSDKTFKITDGARLEFRIDIVDVPSASPQDFSILGYIPHGPADFAALTEYHVAFTAAQFYVGKNYGQWWEIGYTPSAGFPPQSNCRLIQTFTGEGTSVRIESRLEDLSKDVNDPARVFYQIMHVDSSSAYLNFDGYFALSQYRNAAPGNVAVIWDNAEVNSVVGGNTAPILSGATPVDGQNFYPAAGGVAFNVNDDASAPADNIKLTLNGVVYTNGSPGVAITPPGGSSISRHFTLANLAPNTFYTGSIQASDDLGATTKIHYEFDTFTTNNLQIEAEDFNYSSNPGTDGGLFFDTGLNAYLDQQGTPEIDYHDSRSAGDSGNPIPYRPLDSPRQYPTGDPARAKYVIASQPEYLVYDNENGDWRNYTRTYPAGTFNVYSRQSTFALALSQVTLEKVTSDPHTNNQTAYVMGAFQQLGDAAGDTGYDVHRDVPLTDAAGNPLVVRFAGGVETLRVRDVFVNDRNNADIFHNYLVFVPTADPGTLRPIVSMTSPQAGTTSRISNQSEATFAEIANRDTAVNANTITMTINGVPAAITVTNTTGGAQVYWSFAALSPAPAYTHTLSFQDTAGSNLVYSWTYSYPFLRASNSLPLGALSTRGFHVRTVQSDNGGANLGNSLSRAEDQLAIPPVIPVDISYEGDIADTLDWSNDNATPKDVPGLTGVPGTPVPLNNIASEALGYIELAAGPHRFSVSSDDGFQLRSGTTPKDLAAVVIGQQDGSTFGGTFDFVVEAAGLYPVRNLWEENGGGANFTLRSVNLADNSTTVVNDPLDPSGVVKAYLPGVPTLVWSSPTAAGPYQTVGGALINAGAKTVTVPAAGSSQFYRLSSASAVTIKTINLVGNNVVITYQ